MTTSRRLLLLLPLAALLVAPAVALGCSIAVRPPLEPRIAPADVRVLNHHRGARGAWVGSPDWISSRVSLVETIRPRFAAEPITAAFAQQRSLRLIASRPMDGDYYDDEDPATTCELTGKRVYSATRLLVHETPRAIFITLVSRPTSGSTAGCKVMSTSCDDTVMRYVSFDAPIGERRLYAVTFASATTA